MELSLNDENDFLLEKVFNNLTFVSEDGEGLGVRMRDSGFEVSYVANGKEFFIEMKGGEIITNDLSKNSPAFRVLHRKNSSKKEKTKRGSALTQK